MSGGGVLSEQNKTNTASVLTTKNLTSVSKNKNIIIFCIDSFDGKLYAEPAMKDYPEIFDSLNGFTYYNDTISIYSNTYPSVCYMLTNIEKTENNRKDYFNNAYSNNKTLSLLSKNNYDVNLYTESFYSYDEAFNLPNYITNKEISHNIESSISLKNRLKMTFRFIQISLYRSLPIILKPYFSDVDSTTCNGYVVRKVNDLEGSLYSSDMKEVYNTINEKDFLLNQNNSFSFIHFTGCHGVEYDENWEKTTSQDMNISVKNSFKIINTYLDKLKSLENGQEIYKNSTIIITGDHASILDDYKELDGTRLTGFMFKPSGVDDGNPLTNVSNKPISHEDMWKSIFESEKITNYDESIKGYNILDESLIPVNRERHYWLTTENIAHTLYRHSYYQINGSGRQYSNWKLDDSKSIKVNQYLYD